LLLAVFLLIFKLPSRWMASLTFGVSCGTSGTFLVEVPRALFALGCFPGTSSLSARIMAHSDFPSWQVARPFLKHFPLLHGDGQTVLDLILLVVHDRACLLAELPDSVLPRLTGNRPNVFLPAIEEAVRNSRIAVGISSDPRRFLPQTAFVLLLHREVEWNDVVRFSKPKNFSWTEVVAAKGPTSADAIGVALEEIYEPSHRSRALLDT
jgi:hypothetical protein